MSHNDRKMSEEQEVSKEHCKQKQQGVLHNVLHVSKYSFLLKYIVILTIYWLFLLNTKRYICYVNWRTPAHFSTSSVIPFCTALNPQDSGFVSLPATSPVGY